MADAKQIIADVLSTLKAAQTLAKAQEDDGGLGDQLMEAREGLQTVREELATLGEQIVALADEIESLQESIQLAPSLVRNQGVYWTKSDPDPWCPNCWEHDQRAVHMNPTAVLAGRLCVCKKCGYDINLDNVKPPKKWPA